MLHGIEVIGPDPHVASLARHKFHAMALLQSAGVPVPPTFLFIPQTGWLDGRRPDIGSSVIIKPSHEAASIGVDALSLLRSDSGLDAAVADRAEIFQQPMTVQEFIPGREVEVPVFSFGREYYTPLAVGLSLGGAEDLSVQFLDYETVAADRYGFYEYARCGDAKKSEIFAHAGRSAAVLGIRDFGRIDFRIDDSDRPWAIDVSTSPYISRHSSFAFAVQACAGDAANLPLALLSACCDRIGLLPS
jgi:D-alanine-D-alanine ligase